MRAADARAMLPATPGCRRAVKKAAKTLEKLGHNVFQIKLSGLEKAVMLLKELSTADNGKGIMERLGNGPVDYTSIGLYYIAYKIPLFFRGLVSSFINIWSPKSAGLFSPSRASKSADLWKFLEERKQVIEAILREMESLKLDVIIAPGMAMPAQPIGSPVCQLASNNYTAVYNMLNFPVGSLPVSWVS